MAHNETVDSRDIVELTLDGKYVEAFTPLLDLNPADACNPIEGFCGGCDTCMFLQASHAGYQAAPFGLLTIQINSWEIDW